MTYQAPKQHPKVNKGERRFDRTSLKANNEGKLVHRDYAAHWFRWGYAQRFVDNQTRVLDIGCGPDRAMMNVLTYQKVNVPALYVGVDMNPIREEGGAAWAHFHGAFDFTDRAPELVDKYGRFDLVTCFEVIEHMSYDDGAWLLAGIRACLAPGGTALLSTPVYNEHHMAANHIHEYRYDELAEAIADAGFTVERVHGTFMTIPALRKVMSAEEAALVDVLAGYYSWNVLSNFLAPKYPRASSNCCWVLKGAA